MDAASTSPPEGTEDSQEPKSPVWGLWDTDSRFPTGVFQLWCPEVVIVVPLSWTSTFLRRCGLLFSHWEWLGMCERFPQVATLKDPGLPLETFSTLLGTVQRLVATAATVDAAASNDRASRRSNVAAAPAERRTVGRFRDKRNATKIKASSQLCSQALGQPWRTSPRALMMPGEFMDTFEAQNGGLIISSRLDRTSDRHN